MAHFCYKILLVTSCSSIGEKAHRLKALLFIYFYFSVFWKQMKEQEALDDFVRCLVDLLAASMKPSQ